MEMNHDELRAFFLQLNAIQAQLDAAPVPPSA
jgi:hypothetical protein